MKRRRGSDSGTPEGSQAQEAHDLIASQVNPEDARIILEVVNSEALIFDPTLRGMFGAAVPSQADQVAINATLSQIFTPDSSYPTEETSEEFIAQTPPSEEGFDVIMGESPREKPTPREESTFGDELTFRDEPTTPRAEDFDAEEFDEDALYVGETAEEIVGEALDELLNAVITEMSGEGYGEPQVLRWLILENNLFTKRVNDLRKAAVSDLKEKISELLQDPSMVER